jgi:hypothetical protein
MIRRVLFGLMWFVIIFIVSYLGMYEAAQAFRNTYMIFFAIGSLILTMAGTISGVLPGTKRKASTRKQPGTKKKARKKRKW